MFQKIFRSKIKTFLDLFGFILCITAYIYLQGKLWAFLFVIIQNFPYVLFL